MNELIEAFKNDFPSEAIEIQECLDLLSQVLDEGVDSIKNKFNSVIDERDYNKWDLYRKIVQLIDNFRDQINGFASKLNVDVDENMDEADSERTIPNYEDYRVDSNIPYTLYNDFTYKRPSGFELLGIRYDANDWKSVLVNLCELLVSKDYGKFELFLSDKSMNGKKLKYFSKDENEIRSPRRIGNTDIFVMTNMSANQIRTLISSMLRKYKINLSECKIYLRADYSPLH